MVVTWVRKAVVGSGHGWCAARLPPLPPTVHQAVTQDGGCWLKAGSPRSHTPAPTTTHTNTLFQLLCQNYQRTNIGGEEIEDERGGEMLIGAFGEDWGGGAGD